MLRLCLLEPTAFHGISQAPAVTAQGSKRCLEPSVAGAARTLQQKWPPCLVEVTCMPTTLPPFILVALALKAKDNAFAARFF